MQWWRRFRRSDGQEIRVPQTGWQNLNTNLNNIDERHWSNAYNTDRIGHINMLPLMRPLLHHLSLYKYNAGAQYIDKSTYIRADEQNI